MLFKNKVLDFSRFISFKSYYEGNHHHFYRYWLGFYNSGVLFIHAYSSYYSLILLKQISIIILEIILLLYHIRKSNRSSSNNKSKSNLNLYFRNRCGQHHIIHSGTLEKKEQTLVPSGN